MHVSEFPLESHGTCYLEVSESIYLGLTQQLLIQYVDAGASLQLLVNVYDMLQFLQEPLINLRQVVYLVDGIVLVHGLGDDEDTLVGRLAQCCIYVGYLQFLVLHEAMHALANHSESLLQSLLEIASDGHHLSYRLHARAKLLVYTTELGKIPTWNLADHVVEGRLEECAGGACNGILQLKQSIAHSQLCSHESKRIACSLGCKS